MVSTLKINSITDNNFILNYTTTTADTSTTNSFSTDWFLDSTSNLINIDGDFFDGVTFNGTVFTCATEHGRNDGDEITVTLISGSAPTGITINNIYYIKPTGAKTFKLFNSLADVEPENSPVTISGTNDISNLKFSGTSEIHLAIKHLKWELLNNETNAYDICWNDVTLTSVDIVNLGDGSDIFKIQKDTTEGQEIGIAYKITSTAQPSTGIKALDSNELYFKINGSEGTGTGTIGDPFIIGSFPFFIIQGNDMETDPSNIIVHMKVNGFVAGDESVKSPVNIPYQHIANKPINYVRNNFKFKPASLGATDSSTLLLVEKANTLFNGMKNGTYPRFPIDYSQFKDIQKAANWSV